MQQAVQAGSSEPHGSVGVNTSSVGALQPDGLGLAG